MKDFFRFLAHPTQEKTAKPRDLAFASVLYFLVGPVICVAGALVQAFALGGEGPAMASRTDMTFVYLCFGVLMEELAFRMPLRNHLPARILSSLALGFVVSRIFFGHLFASKWIAMLVVGTPLAVPIFFALGAMHKQLKFPLIFYFFALLFGLAHLSNLTFDSFSLATLWFVFYYTLDKFCSGAILGYLRVQTNLLLPYLLHLALDTGCLLLPKILKLL